MNKEEIISYVMKTPENTNPNVLRSLLDSDGGGLPPVTSEDNGKVIKVKNGEYGLNVPIEFKNPELDSLQNDEMALIHGENYDNISSILIVNGLIQNQYKVLSVSVLPDVGDNTDDFTILYLLDGEDGFEACKNNPYDYLYSYVLDDMAPSVGIPAGWYKTSILIEQLFGGLPDAVLMTKNEAKTIEVIDASKLYIIVDEFLVYNNKRINGYEIISDIVKTIKDEGNHYVNIDNQLIKLWSALGCKVRLETYFNVGDDSKNATLELSGFIDNTAIFSLINSGILCYASLDSGYISTGRTDPNIFPQASNKDSYKVLKALYDDYHGLVTYTWVDYGSETPPVSLIVYHGTGDTYYYDIESFVFDDCLNKYFNVGQVEFSISESGSNPQNPDHIASFYVHPHRSNSGNTEIYGFYGGGFGIDKDGNLCYVSGGIEKNHSKAIFNIKRYSGLTKISQ